MQLIIVLETKNDKGSDYYYYRAIRERFYYDRGNKLTSVFMNGKGNYRNVKIKIDNYIKEYAATAGEPTAVIYFVDVDSDSYQGDQKQLNKDIKKFCSDNGYEIVWFKKDVEHVMLGEQVSDDLKTQKARSFFAQKKIYKVDENLLNRDSKNLKDKESNVLKVLDYYLERR